MGTKTQKLSNVVDQIVEWQSVFTGDGSTGLTAVAGRGYFIDTTSGSVTVTLPASPKQGDVVQLKDYARTWGTNAVSLASALFDGSTNTNTFSTNGQTLTLVYMDNTKGWSLINEDTTTDIGDVYTEATGGTITTSGDYKIHSFTGDGCFVVSTVGNTSGGSNEVSYLVIAGGGGGSNVGGGGAGGFREGKASNDCYSASPLVAPTGLNITAQTYPITVGSGGTGYPESGSYTSKTPGSNSVFSTITSAGGGAGQGNHDPGPSPQTDGPGGSGGGGMSGDYTLPGGTGNTPPVSPSQGNNGGNASTGDGANWLGGGGGGAGAAGAAGGPNSGAGGNGATTSITASPTTYAGGAGSGGYNRNWSNGGTGGGGDGGGPAPTDRDATSGTANTGGGGGGQGLTGAGGNRPAGAGSGGKGLVVIRYKFQ